MRGHNRDCTIDVSLLFRAARAREGECTMTLGILPTSELVTTMCPRKECPAFPPARVSRNCASSAQACSGAQKCKCISAAPHGSRRREPVRASPHLVHDGKEVELEELAGALHRHVFHQTRRAHACTRAAMHGQISVEGAGRATRGPQL